MPKTLIMLALAIWLTMLAVASLSQAAEAPGFPGRQKYPNVPVISKQDLMKQYDGVTIVDTRSSLEFETLRIRDAINIPVAAKDFIDQVKALRNQSNKAIVFYCNGRTCMKSYKAAKACKRAGIEDTYAYDAGMFEWARTYPSHASLLGHSPIAQSDIISKTKFESHNLSPQAFTDAVYKNGSKSLIVDIRDKYQRGAAGFFPAQERWVSLDNRAKLNEYINLAQKEDRPLFIYDEVGKQVRWLQYALEKANVKNYYFLQDGARGYYKHMMSEFGIR